MDELETRRKALDEKIRERREEAKRSRELQELEDEEKIFELEGSHLGLVKRLRIDHVDGLPCLLAVRCPSPAEAKRYRDRIAPDRQGRPGDRTAAAEQVGRACLLYPDEESFGRICEIRPAVAASVGLAALAMAVAEVEDEGKD